MRLCHYQIRILSYYIVILVIGVCCQSYSESNEDGGVGDVEMADDGDRFSDDVEAHDGIGEGFDQDYDGADPSENCDADRDGFQSFSCGGTDCCDDGTEESLGCTPETASDIYPGAVEVINDGVDQDCDGSDPTDICDLDRDGYSSFDCGGSDCCDAGTEGSLGCRPENASEIFPGAPEILSDGVDQDCDGVDQSDNMEDFDNDGYINSALPGGDDCDDFNASIHPGAEEVCDGVDQNCNGAVDEGFILDSDPNNCGRCGVVCPSDQTCVEGLCQ